MAAVSGSMRAATFCTTGMAGLLKATPSRKGFSFSAAGFMRAQWDGTLTATDGPFMETKEYLSGFFIVEARDLNEAIDLAARMPLAKMGSIEVRPLGTLTRQPV